MLLFAFLIILAFATHGQGCNRTPLREGKDIMHCGYKACDLGKPGLINIHLISHSHDDVGWLKTVDQYYYGSKNSVANAGVQYILDSVIVELMKDPSRRFIYVEVAFFYRWWNEQNDFIRHQVKQLVNEGRFEFILGGWCMNDEAATHYNAIIDQHTLGLKFLEDNFGECGRPRAAWQIDPFGHSKEQASLFAQMGYDGIFFARIDEQDRVNRKATKTMEMVWQGSNNLGEAADLFTGVFFTHYSSPSGFSYDSSRRDQPIMDDDRLHDGNVKERVDKFISLMTEMSSRYATNHYLQTMGDDFNYMNANINFKNMDKLITYVNARQSKGSKINLLYSTPTCYLYALNQANYTWPTKTDDFFPYAPGPHIYWTGYFTSRPALKYYVRQTNSFLQACKQLDTLAQLGVEHNSDIKVGVLKRAMATAQHHDAVSGTEVQNVADDYALRLANGTAECKEVVSDALQKLMAKSGTFPPRQYFCNLLNISMCNFTETRTQFTVTIYNPLARPIIHWARIPVEDGPYDVLGPYAERIETQVIDIENRTRSIPERNSSKSQKEVVMRVHLEPLGFSTFFFNKTTLDADSATRRVVRASPSVYNMRSNQRREQITTLQNQHILIDVDPVTGMLTRMVNKDKLLSIPLQQSIRYYSANQGKGLNPPKPPSGAYIFRPKETFPNAITTKVTTKLVQGNLVQELHQTFSPWATQVVRLYDDQEYAELEWTVGPIPIDDKQGKEVVAYFSTGLASNKTFYTDANGREIQTRIRDFRPTWKLGVNEPVAGNYYPVNSRIYIQDEINKSARFTVMTDRSLGGASIKDGDLEIMVHRRLFMQAQQGGMHEALNETGSDGKGLIVRGKMYLLLDTIEDSGQLHRELGERLFMAPLTSFSDNPGYKTWSSNYKTSYSGLKMSLPPNVHLLTLEQWRGTTFLLRLEHFYEKNEHPTLSKNVTFSLKGLFKPFEIQSIDELTLGANQKLEYSHRLKWRYNRSTGSSDAENTHKTEQYKDKFDITLTPMQIRTFQVSIMQR
ncbi:lysosomal alpha-mannosidase-like [Lineus longissimus]|uniref:lysosomal alpha-mannosidase-like n=1 Tax=Lineus longissimus TaxID=88925 RepID=UPI002B4F37E3